MVSEQRIRAVLFYLSVGIFCIGLPLILSFALSYRFSMRSLRFVKTGLIAVKTQPSGASVYLEKKLLAEKTPMTINELLPGKYPLRVELADYYPWISDVIVDAGKVTRIDKIILFPVRPNVKQLTQDRSVSFWLDDKKGAIYYINNRDNSIYRLDLDGLNPEEIAVLPFVPDTPLSWKISPDGKKILCFNASQIVVAYLDNQYGSSAGKKAAVFKYPRLDIVGVFWHSDSYHLVIVTRTNIETLEARPHSLAVDLIPLRKENTRAFYDVDTDTLYFLDSQQASDGNFYDNIYKLDLGAKNSALRDLMRLRPMDQDLSTNGISHKLAPLKQLIKPQEE